MECLLRGYLVAITHEDSSGDAEIGLPGRAYFRRGPALAMHAGLGMRFD
jgi:hypothetical protein